MTLFHIHRISALSFQGSMNAATMFALCAKKEGMGKRHNEPNSLPLTTVDSYTKFQEYMKTLENKGPESLPEKFANGAVVGKLQKGTKDVSELKQVQVEQHSVSHVSDFIFHENMLQI